MNVMTPAYGVYILQLIRYARACSSSGDFIERGRLLTKKLVGQDYTLEQKETLESFMVDTMICYHIEILPFRRLCVT